MKALLLLLILLYRRLASGLKPYPSCRFLPSCSAYAAEAVALHGAWRGSLLSARRLCRCHPWGACGHDPVPSA